MPRRTRQRKEHENMQTGEGEKEEKYDVYLRFTSANHSAHQTLKEQLSLGLILLFVTN